MGENVVKEQLSAAHFCGSVLVARGKGDFSAAQLIDLEKAS